MKNSHRCFKIILILFTGFVFRSLSAAPFDSKGNDFWLMFPHWDYPDVIGTISLNIASDVNTSGVIYYPWLDSTINFSVTGGNLKTIIIPFPACIHTSNVIDFKGIHITTLSDISIIGITGLGGGTSSGFLGLPADALGKDYYVLTYKNTGVRNGTEFSIVSTADGTIVTITPSVTTNNRIAGIPFNINLQEGETFSLMNVLSDTADLTGTHIASTKPVGVFGAHRCANIPAGADACDHICEMLIPNNCYGKMFFAVPFAERVNGDTWRVLASEDFTNIDINGINVTQINKGNYFETIITNPSQITADKPVLVCQYANGLTYSGNPGDPSMMIVPPVEQYQRNYTIPVHAVYNSNYINIICSDSVVGSLTLDGVPVPVINFSSIGNSGYSGARLLVDSGCSKLLATIPFGCLVYILSNTEAISYPGGINLAQYNIADLTLFPENESRYINTETCIDGLLTGPGNELLEGVKVNYIVKGVNPGSGFIYTDSNGIARFCYTGHNIGKDTVLGFNNDFRDTAFRQWENPLPVELMSFESSINRNMVHLNWTTSNEINNKGFEIQRSSAAIDWKLLNFIEGKGNSEEIIHYSFEDRNLTSGKYNYRLKQIDYNGNYKYYDLSNEVVIGIPEKFFISQNYPNPFNPTTKIDYEIPSGGKVNIILYDVSGREVETLVNETLPAGYYTLNFNGSSYSSGIYFYKIVVTADESNKEKFMMTKRMVMVK